MQNLFLALEQIGKEGRGLKCGSILIGAGPETEADVLVGRCAGVGKETPVDVPGCPPSPGLIYERFVDAEV